MLADYGIVLGKITMYCDNTSAINISKNSIQYSRTKHIDIRHQFVRDLVESKTVILDFVVIDKQLDDIFTKPLDSIIFDSFLGNIFFLSSFFWLLLVKFCL